MPNRKQALRCIQKALRKASAQALRDGIKAHIDQTQTQIDRVEHYEIAAYGTDVALARALGEQEVAALLSEMLEEEKQTDLKLTEVAQKAIMQEALAGEENEGGHGGGRSGAVVRKLPEHPKFGEVRGAFALQTLVAIGGCLTAIVLAHRIHA